MEKFKVGGQKPITFDRFIRGVIALLLIAGTGLAIYYLSGVLIPFFVAWAVAYTLYPVVCFIQKLIRNRLAAIAITLVLTLGLIAGFFYIVVPPMIEEFGHLKNAVLDYIQRGTAGNTTIPAPVEEFFKMHASEYQIKELLQQKDVVEGIKNTLPKVWNFVWSTAGILINIAASLIALLYLLFLLTDYEKYANGWIKFVPKSKRNITAQVVGDVERGMIGYFRGQALIALSNCVMFSIGFAIIDFPMPIALGCLIGVISFVPYLQVVGIVPASLLAILKAAETGQNFWGLMALVLLVYIVVQILQDTIFTPHIMGKIMGLPPAMILLSLSVWGFAFGIVGLILALPVTTLIISYYKRYVIGEEGDINAPLDPESIAAEKAAGIYVEAPCETKRRSKRTKSSQKPADEKTDKVEEPTLPTPSDNL